jgi:phage repressor protein C with HTH and peptisase S24 domain
MTPTLRDGDWLLVDPDARAASAGNLVVADDPRQTGRLIVKRVKSVESDGSRVLGGDHPAHGNEELRVSDSAIRGQPWFRYWPPGRIGRLSSRY